MATGLGLRIGESESVAAIVTSGRESEPEYVVRETVLHMSDNGDSALGGTPPEVPSRTVSGFLAHVGDPAGIVVDDGAAFRAEDLVATAMFCLINLSSSKLVAPTEIHASYPADWSGDAVDALRDALDYLGLGSLTLTAAANGVAGKEAALGAASTALTAAIAGVGISGNEFAQLPTEELPLAQALIAGPMVAALAYSTVGGPSVAAAPPPEAEEVTDKAAVVEPTSSGRRKPVMIAASVAGALAIVGGIFAVLAQSTATTDVPKIQDANNESATTTAGAPAAPVVFPTTTAPAPPPPLAPAPPPQPVTVYVTAEPPPPPPPLPTPLPSAPPTTSQPVATTTPPTTTATTQPTPTPTVGETTTTPQPPPNGFYFEYTPPQNLPPAGLITPG